MARNTACTSKLLLVHDKVQTDPFAARRDAWPSPHLTLCKKNWPSWRRCLQAGVPSKISSSWEKNPVSILPRSPLPELLIHLPHSHLEHMVGTCLPRQVLIPQTLRTFCRRGSRVARRKRNRMNWAGDSLVEEFVSPYTALSWIPMPITCPYHSATSGFIKHSCDMALTVLKLVACPLLN